MIITDEWLINNRTHAGSYNKKQLNILDIEWPPQKGWKDKVIGKELCEEKVKEFKNCINIKKIKNNNNLPNKLINNNILYKEESKLINIFDISKFNINYFVYTDGACINNGYDNASACIGIYFQEDDIRNISKKIIGKQSNNVAELQAIVDVYDIIKNDIIDKKICIVSDSQYALNCITSYGLNQSKNNWKKDIPNKDLVKNCYELYKDKNNIYFTYIKAHTENDDIHSKGNDGADKLANKACGLEGCPYNISVNKFI